MTTLTKTAPIRFNGWQRLWLLASILWAVVILKLAGILRSDREQTVQGANAILLVVRLWIVPVAAVYGFRPWPRLGPPRISRRVSVAGHT
jgi:hypothetical protein